MASHAHYTSSSSSSSSSSSRWEYDVFLSFSGGETRKKFTSHLFNALDNKGVRTFMDNEELRTGNEIGLALLAAIEQSRISIPIFSRNYASSKWCLQELAKILECYKTKSQIVLPIFLDVEPSEVRNQTGRFGEAFRKRKRNFEVEMVKKWKKALREVGKLKGWDLKEVENGDESKLVQLVVGRVLTELNTTPFFVAEHPIGLEHRVEYLLSLLNIESTDSQFVGICGMGRIGKTTIAKAVYNRIFKKFDGCSFLADVREHASKHKGLVRLQNQLLNDILGKQKYHISHAHGGSKLIEQRLQKIKVLLILDDVDHHMQLNALAGELSWFAPGSNIIITTRDEHVLKVGKVEKTNIYKPEGLDEGQSLQLFSMHAFRRCQPPEDYIQLSRNMVSYAGGLPLTLKVLGSFLYDVNGKEKWESALQKLKKVPPNEVQNKLKISYDGLDNEEKAIFLDTACFFIGMDKDIAVYIWDGCGFYPKIGLEVLIRKSLVRIGDKNELSMHDQLRDMGRRIVYEESPKKHGERSRLWCHEEVLEVLMEHKGTQEIEGILLDFWGRGILSCFEWETREHSKIREHFRILDFAAMSNLRLLLVNGVDIEGNIEQLSTRLRWLCWRCPLEILPSNFYQENLVVLDLSYSYIRESWNSGLCNKRFENLKVLDLSRCIYLSNSPNFSGFPCLERLVLKECSALIDVNESISQLKRLVHLDLSGCSKLIEFPCGICMLYSLRELILTVCCEIKKLPKSFGDLKSLEDLKLNGTRIRKLPNSIGMLSTMRCLSISGFLPLKRIPDSFWKIKSLVEVYLGSLNIRKIPDTIGLLSNLERLCVTNCQNIESLPPLPSSLICLDASNCFSLKRLSDLSNLKNLRTLRLILCTSLAEIQGLEGAETLEELDMIRCDTLTNTMICVHVQDSFKNQLLPFCDIQERYVIDEDMIMKEKNLCIVFKLEEVQTNNYTEMVTVRIHRNGKRIDCTGSFRTEDIQMAKIYIHSFQGLNWFGFPLKGKDQIEIVGDTLGSKLKVKCYVMSKRFLQLFIC